MEAIIYNSAPQQEALANRLFNKIMSSNCPQRIKDGLTAYSIGILHPTDNRVALPIERSGYYWQYIENELTPAELNSIKNIGDEWLPEIEL